ncbi:hypothetical protein DVA67_014245 [Solirubrobacter sp. CPCC 204708]|uniref:LPXTG cell wall anchor domain-containing protein n=1 Tax=Solirubrobacter deserti TaxID=2282478 RepID=A0ABT4RBS1_9ACTN|nr:hypothetical protein [Solirubrobacter deserti]MBE2317138.1 hypothetical protein [Solirubrobacter deserti]MDA0135969.1 hypothetical protein [Solirubrobacter deserti]
MTRSIALISTALVLAFAAPAGAQSGAFGPLPAAEPTATPTPTPIASDNGETSLALIAIIGGALIVGFGIMGFFIMRDARSAAPKVVAAGPALDEPATGARKPHTAAAKKKMRAKTKAQKQARKAHRR